MHSGQLRRVGQANLKPGVAPRQRHDGDVRRLPAVGCRYRSNDPAQLWVLVSAVVMLGLLVSLLVKRRRVWARIRVLDDGPDGRNHDVL